MIHQLLKHKITAIVNTRVSDHRNSLQYLSRLVYTALVPYLVLVLVVVGLLTPATAKAAEPKKIIIGGGAGFEPMILVPLASRPLSGSKLNLINTT